MKKNVLILVPGFFLFSGISIFLYFNYTGNQTGSGRIASETGYWLFLTAVLLFSVVYAILQFRVLSKTNIFSLLLMISLMVTLSLSLDMLLHYYARNVVHIQNTTNELLSDSRGTLALFEQTWQIYKPRFITVLVIADLPLFVTLIFKTKKQKS